jgi:hypothetical protein
VNSQDQPQDIEANETKGREAAATAITFVVYDAVAGDACALNEQQLSDPDIMSLSAFDPCYIDMEYEKQKA